MAKRIEVIPWAEDDPPTEEVLRRRLEDEGYNVFYWQDAPGADYAPHSHERDESLWLITGEMALAAAGKKYRLHPGDRLMLPKGTVHTAHAGAAGCVYLIGELP
ncbi:MAG: hypothetical protein QOD06_3164 [Candidatus Binatota bacterium]|jgi:quercetin dioxygenase-like cupin family protein|nr:hypothetical protein [Candidatus Binatota bacterium]